MARIISFVALVAIVIVVGVLFYQVMATFLLPLFLATILVIVFRPLHERVLARVKRRNRLAAGLTTLAILLIVFLPLIFVLVQGSVEGWSIVRTTNQDLLMAKISRLRRRCGLELPPIEIRQALEGIDLGLAKLDTEPIPGIAEVDHKQLVSELLPLVEQVRAWSDNPLHLAGLSPPPARLGGALKALVDQLQELAKLDRDEAEFGETLGLAQDAQQEVKRQLLGDKLTYWVRAKVNPTKEDLQSVRAWLQELLAPAALEVTPVLLKIVVGMVIMTIALYYFLADGPAMLASLSEVSPLDKVYQQRLLAEFGKISRAVVAATLLSAVVQGVLAGIGFKLAGLEAVFLLSVLTMFGAMIPFAGAAIVWVPCVLWLFVDGHPYAAAFLAVYGVLVVSLADNLIKPLVLHGQSNLHPLLALLSVLGGVKALGPIGIFVGPMAVVFLQVVWQMLHTELKAWEKRAAAKGA